MKSANLLAAMVILGIAQAQAAPSKPNAGPSLLPGGNSKDPVSIEADKLVYFDKEQKAIYSGNVIVIQGDTKLTCSIMTIYMEKSSTAPTGTPTPSAAPTPAKPPDSNAAAAGGSDSSSTGDSGRIKHMDCTGPVTVLSKTQTATGDTGAYDKPQNKVWLTGHVTLSDGGNVTKGEKLIYDLTTGQATVETGGSTGRVKGQFLPNGADSNASPKPKTSN